ncbi:MAG: hypothetical protein Ct9H300mP1_30830 [Planctomycetaceae bacterium]|nr:MAG: hypothetical protein Ct9H300mP1_30830 [Planctomycetaceae bacterium]
MLKFWFRRTLWLPPQVMELENVASKSAEAASTPRCPNCTLVSWIAGLNTLAVNSGLASNRLLGDRNVPLSRMISLFLAQFHVSCSDRSQISCSPGWLSRRGSAAISLAGIARSGSRRPR